MSFLPTLLGAVCVAVMVVSDAQGAAKGRAAAKVLASLCFVSQAVINEASGTFAERLVTLGLVASLAGDVLLIWREKRQFLAGIGAFLIAHVLYILAFASLGFDTLAAMSALAALGVGTGLLASRFVPRAGSLGPAVFGYIVVITVMGALAFGSAVAAPGAGRLVLAGAALSFMASDVCVARDRFEHTGFSNRAAGWVMYYTAQFSFAWAIGSA